jgi:hypothetical protein
MGVPYRKESKNKPILNQFILYWIFRKDVNALDMQTKLIFMRERLYEGFQNRCGE